VHRSGNSYSGVALSIVCILNAVKSATLKPRLVILWITTRAALRLREIETFSSPIAFGHPFVKVNLKLSRGLVRKSETFLISSYQARPVGNSALA
jgi:hypothetical protein